MIRKEEENENATFIEERWLDGFGGDSKGRINRIIEMKMGREEVYKCKRQRVPGNAAQEMRKRSNENNDYPVSHKSSREAIIRSGREKNRIG